MSLVRLRPTPPTTTTPSSPATSSASPTLTQHAKDPGFLAKLAKWGVTGAIVTGLVVPALIALQIATAPRSPADLQVPPPAPPAITQPVDVFQPQHPPQGPPVVVTQPTQPTQPAQPTRPAQPTPAQPAPPADSVVVAPPSAPVVAPPVVTQPPAVTPPVVAPPVVEQPTVASMVSQALHDGVVDVGEAKAIVHQLRDVADIRLVAAAYNDGRVTNDARVVLDTFFVRNGVPAGAGVTTVTQKAATALADGSLTPLRGRLQTQNMMRVDLAPSSSLPRGATGWVAPGPRAQLFLQLPGQGVFGPVALTTRTAS